MKSARIFIPLIAVGVLGFGGAWAQPPEGEQWVPTFREDFNGAALDGSVWMPGLPPGPTASLSPSTLAPGSGEPARIVLSDGALHLVLRHRPGDGVTWRSASLFTRHFRQTYGYFEARLRYARSTGLADIFRLVTDRPRGAGSLEIAINEGTYPSHIRQAVRRDGHLVDLDKSTLFDSDLSADYHVFGLAWLPGGKNGPTLTWYVDGQPVHSATCRDCARPLGLWLGTEVRTWDGPFAPVPDGAAMDVDFVRVYQLRSLSSVQSVTVPPARPRAKAPVADAGYTVSP